LRFARSGSHGLCLPATFRPQGLVALSTGYSLADLVGLISCRQRLWGSPFGAFSSIQVPRRFRRLTPRLPSPQTLYGPHRSPAKQRAYSSASGFFLEPSLSRLPWVFSPRCRRMLPWAFSLSRVFHNRLDGPFGPSPPTRLPFGPVTRSEGTASRSLDRRLSIPTTGAGNPS